MRVMSMSEVAGNLGVCIPTINRAIKLGKGPTLTRISDRRVGVTEENFAAWLKERAAEPAKVAEVAT